MEKEFLTKTHQSVTLNVTDGKIDSFREQEETTGTVRIYDNGCIGVAGCLGTPDEQALTEKAVEALALGIPYPCRLGGAQERECLKEEEILPVSALIPTMLTLLLMRLGNVLNVGFEKVLLLQNSSTLSTSDILSTYVYRLGITQMKYSFASAVGLFNNVVGLVILMFFNTLSRKIANTSLW